MFYLKIKSCHLLIGYTNVSSLMSIQQRCLKILSGLYIHMTRFTVDLWLIYLKINRGRWFTRMYQCIKFDVCLAKGSQDIEWSIYSYVQFDPWPLTIWFNNQYWLSTLHGVPVYKQWSLSSKGFLRYWDVSIFICPVWPLTIDLKINRIHLLFRKYQCMKFEVCQAKGSQDIEWTKYSYF
jgi:hypothetical protein